MLITLARHGMAVAAAFAAQWAAKHGVALTPEQVTALMLAVYAAAEKMLKPAAAVLGEKA